MYVYSSSALLCSLIKHYFRAFIHSFRHFIQPFISFNYSKQSLFVCCFVLSEWKKWYKENVYMYLQMIFKKKVCNETWIFLHKNIYFNNHNLFRQVGFKNNCFASHTKEKCEENTQRKSHNFRKALRYRTFCRTPTYHTVSLHSQLF